MLTDKQMQDVHVIDDSSDGLIVVSTCVAEQLLSVRDALVKGDCDEALFALVHISDPHLSCKNEWANLEAAAGSVPNAINVRCFNTRYK